MKDTSVEPSPQPRRTLGQAAKQAGLFLLFGTILVIPRIRRLRRRVWAWTLVRLAVAACGGWLAWAYTHARVGTASLALGLVLVAFSLLFRAKPAVKSVDSLAQELSALIVLNGGTCRSSPDVTPIPQTQVFIHPERIMVLGPRERRVVEIPWSKVRNIAVYPAANGTGKGTDSWEVGIDWLADGPCSTLFQYDGAFAEHLARVTEATLKSQWKKDLPIITQ